MNNICTCTCHHNPLLWHFNDCCQYKGKLYINDDGTIDIERYEKIVGKSVEKSVENKESVVCPCCGGTGHVARSC